MLRCSYPSRRRWIRPALPAVLCAALLVAAGCQPGDSSSSPAPADSARSASGSNASSEVAEKITVLVVGNSLAAGYGLSDDQAFPALLQQKADSAGLRRIEVVNAGNSGETTAGGLRRIDWLLQRDDVDVLLLELGANDALRGLPPTPHAPTCAPSSRKQRLAFLTYASCWPV